MATRKKVKKENVPIKTEKEAEIINVNKYVEEDLQITETVKKVDPDTDTLTTPWGIKVKANDIVKVLEEYYSLSDEDKEKEKSAWVELISGMMGQKDGLKIIDIELSSTGSRDVKFIYRKI